MLVFSTTEPFQFKDVTETFICKEVLENSDRALYIYVFFFKTQQHVSLNKSTTFLEYYSWNVAGFCWPSYGKIANVITSIEIINLSLTIDIAHSF